MLIFGASWSSQISYISSCSTPPRASIIFIYFCSMIANKERTQNLNEWWIKKGSISEKLLCHFRPFFRESQLTIHPFTMYASESIQSDSRQIKITYPVSGVKRNSCNFCLGVFAPKIGRQPDRVLYIFIKVAYSVSVIKKNLTRKSRVRCLRYFVPFIGQKKIYSEFSKLGIQCPNGIF